MNDLACSGTCLAPRAAAHLVARLVARCALLAAVATPTLALGCQWSAAGRDEVVLRGSSECLAQPGFREAMSQQLRESVAMSEFVAGGSGTAGGSSASAARASSRGSAGGRSVETHPLATFGALRAFEAQMVGRRYWGQRLETSRY